VVYVGEPNLLKVFKNIGRRNNKFLVNNIKPIEKEYTQGLVVQFYDSYSACSAQFYQEIGQTFFILRVEQKKQAS
jgi:hypothetical protein